MTEYFNRKSTTSRRRELRQNLTKAEVLLWSVLKDRKLEGFKFRRQFGIGESHYTDEGQEHDKRRQRFLDALAIKIVRVTNPDVYDNLDGVWELLRKTVLEVKASQSKKPQARPAPPLTKGGQGGLASLPDVATTKNACPPFQPIPDSNSNDQVTPPTPPS